MNNRITEEQKNKAIEAYKKYGNMATVGKIIELNRKTLQREMGRSATFKEDMQSAKEAYVSTFEKILDERIAKGEGRADLLLMFKLKAEMPDKYREKIDHKVDATIKVIPAILRKPKE